MAQLEKSGVRENTLLIFTGDNGTDKPIVTPWNGTKVAGGKGSMTDAGTRVPLIANWPAGIRRPGRVVHDLVEFCDLMPTLCEATGAELPANYPGDVPASFPYSRTMRAFARKTGSTSGTEARSWSVTSSIRSWLKPTAATPD